MYQKEHILELLGIEAGVTNCLPGKAKIRSSKHCAAYYAYYVYIIEQSGKVTPKVKQKKILNWQTF